MDSQSKIDATSTAITPSSSLWTERASWVRARANEAKGHETKAILEAIANLYEFLAIRAH